MRSQPVRKLLLALTLAALVAVVACSDDTDGAGDATATPVPTERSAPAEAPELDADTVLHHWQVLAAIAAGDLDDARHHVQHIIDAVAGDPTHVAAMRAVMASLEAGELDEAEHGMEPMLAGRAEPSLTPTGMHLQVALLALEHDDMDDARHHLDHARALGDVEGSQVDEILRFMDDGHHDEAMEHLGTLFAAHGGGMTMGDGHDEDDAPMTELAADRDVPVTMTEFAYEPNVIRAAVGERVRLVVENRGTVLHDLTAEDFRGEVETAGPMGEHEMGGHGDEPEFHAAVNPGDTVTLVFEADAAGEYELFCTVPGHRELGMTARLIIE